MSRLIWEYNLSKSHQIKLIQGDITDEKVDAIVNAANSHLQHGGGVAGAIVRKGGSVIQEESDRIGFVETGHCAITSAGKLPSGYVIHAVGPVWGTGNEEENLYNAVSNSLKLAGEHRFASISIPAISSGIFGFPKDLCARILIRASLDYFKNNPDTTIGEIRFCIIDDLTIDFFLKELQKFVQSC